MLGKRRFGPLFAVQFLGAFNDNLLKFALLFLANFGLYAARLTGEWKHLAMLANRHPLVPFSTLRAGFRLMLHGLSTEMLHGFLCELKARHAAQAAA